MRDEKTKDESSTAGACPLISALFLLSVVFTVTRHADEKSTRNPCRFAFASILAFCVSRESVQECVERVSVRDLKSTSRSGSHPSLQQAQVSLPSFRDRRLVDSAIKYITRTYYTYRDTFHTRSPRRYTRLALSFPSLSRVSRRLSSFSRQPLRAAAVKLVFPSAASSFSPTVQRILPVFSGGPRSRLRARL